MKTLAECYETGLLVEQDYELAKDLYQRAADAGDPEGAFLLSQVMEENGEDGNEWLEKAAAMGWPAACNDLGYIHHYTHHDLPTAEKYYKKAAGPTCSIAYVNLAQLYLETNREAAAVKLLEKAADNG